VRSAAYGVAARVVMAASRGAALVCVSRALGPVGFGAYSIMIATYAVATGLMTLGLDQATLHRTGGSPAAVGTSVRNALWQALVLGAVAAAALLGAGAALRSSIFDHVPPAAMLLTALAVPGVLAHNLLAGVVLGQKWFRYHGFVESTKWLLHAAVIIVLALTSQLGIVTALGALYAPIVLSGAVHCFVLWRANPDVGACMRRLPRRADLQEGLHFGIRACAANVMHVLHLRLDVYLLKWFAGATAVGHYALAVSITDVLLYGGRSVGTVVFAQRASKTAGPRIDTATLARRMILVVGAGAAMVLLFSEPIVTVVFGRSFGGSVQAVHWRLPGLLAETGSLVLTGDFLGRTCLAPMLAGNLAALSFSAAANLIAIPFGGAMAAAMSFSAASLLRYGLLSRFHAKVSGQSVWNYVVPRRLRRGRREP